MYSRVLTGKLSRSGYAKFDRRPQTPTMIEVELHIYSKVTRFIQKNFRHTLQHHKVARMAAITVSQRLKSRGSGQ